MAKEECGCGGHKEETREPGCAGCKADDIFPYWCSSCNRAIGEKRCPYCGLKAQKRK